MLKKIIFCLLILIFQTLYSFAEDQDTLQIKGYFKTYTLTTDVTGNMAKSASDVYTPAQKNNIDLSGTILNLANLDLKWLPSDKFIFETSYILTLPIQAYSGLPMYSSQNAINAPYTGPMIISPTLKPLEHTSTQLRDYRIVDIENNQVHNLDRAVATITLNFGDISIGRQPIAFGVAHVINPVDVLSPLLKTSLATEERPGVDAVRVRIPTGNMSEVEFGFVGGQDLLWSNDAAFLRSRFYLYDTDLILTLMDFKQNALLGFELTRAIFDAGVWLETAYVFSGAFSGSPTSNNNYLRLSTGADYKLTSKLYAFTEYHYNSAGISNPNNYTKFIDTGSTAKNYNTTAYELGSVYLLGQHYIIPGVTIELTPLVTVTAMSFVNLIDASLLFAPNLSYSIATNITLGAGAFIPAGQGSPTQILAKNNKINGLNILTRSEFKLYPDMYFISAMIYF
ncbi:MAG: hypothetical protein HQK91_13710 [Nitrospirae bacterium]|nr:hypothetical protein [Nitrospirota bacterium]MBF0542493.1 hypothetical protein [Nitrospirota bacterium]